MKRIIHTSPFPVFPQVIAEGMELVALGSAIPRELLVNPRSLSSIAREILLRNGLIVAPPVRARNILKRAVFRVAPEADVSSLTSRMKRALEIVLRTGIDLRVLASKGSPRIRQLGLIAAEYRKALRRGGLVDQAETLLVAAELVAERKKLLIYGYFRARHEELLLLDELAADGSEYYLPCGSDPMFNVNNEALAFLIDRGWEVGETNGAFGDQIGVRAAARFAGIPSGESRITAFSSPDIDKEVRKTLASAKRLVRTGSLPEEIAVVARDLTKYGRPIVVAADEYGLPVQMDHTIPLETTGFGGFVMTLLESVDRDFAFEPTARLAMHPFGPGLGVGQIAEARRKRAAGIEQWLQFCPELGGLCDKADKTLIAWAESLISATEALGARKRAVGLTAEWLAYLKFFEALMATAVFEKDQPLSFEVFTSIVHEILGEESVPMRPRRGGVRVLRPEDLVGASFEHVFVLGMAEGVFPCPPKEDPVVDFFERSVLRREHNILFSSASEVAHWEELSFYFTLLAAKKNIVLSFPRVIENAELVPGAFFQKLGLNGDTLAVAREPEYISSTEEARRLMLRQPVLAFDEGLDSARRQHRAELAREIDPFYDEFDGVIGVPIDPATRRWSASQITTIGQCSFRWFAGKLLHLTAVEEMKTGLDGGTRGKLYHKALEIAISRAINSHDIRAATLANLDEAFAEAERDEKVNLPVLPNWEVERREQLKELRKAVESEDFISPGAAVIGVEREFRSTWRGFPLRGTIDRIDKTVEGLIAIDYKTSGQVPKGAKDLSTGKLSVDVQIPIYARVALPTLFPDQPVGTSVYYSLTKRTILRAEKVDDIERLSELAEFLHSILAKGSFAVDPDPQEKACTYCEFTTVCRKGPRLRRKKRQEWS